MYLFLLIVISSFVFKSTFGANFSSLPVGLFIFKIPKVTPEIRDTLIATASSTQNCYRAKHQASPLILDSSISQVSQAWANHLADTDDFEHSGNPNYGENLFEASPSFSDGSTPICYWYKEYQDCDYDFSSEQQQSCTTGHFTQVVWKSSTSVGLAVASSSSSTYFVANYDPPGNYEGQYVANVGPPSDNNIGSCLPQGVVACQIVDIKNIQVL